MTLRGCKLDNLGFEVGRNFTFPLLLKKKKNQLRNPLHDLNFYHVHIFLQ